MPMMSCNNANIIYKSGPIQMYQDSMRWWHKTNYHLVLSLYHSPIESPLWELLDKSSVGNLTSSQKRSPKLWSQIFKFHNNICLHEEESEDNISTSRINFAEIEAKIRIRAKTKVWLRCQKINFAGQWCRREVKQG